MVRPAQIVDEIKGKPPGKAIIELIRERHDKKIAVSKLHVSIAITFSLRNFTT